MACSMHPLGIVKGKPAERRGRKASGLLGVKFPTTAGLPEGLVNALHRASFLNSLIQVSLGMPLVGRPE